MIHTVTLPAITVTLETKDGILPEGTMIQLSVPVRGLVTKPVVETKPVEVPITPVTDTKPIEAPVAPEPVGVETFDRKYANPEFRNKRFDILGRATSLGLNDSNWTIVLNVRFVTFDSHIRVIGSASHKDAGSSLQIGVLKSGLLWVDTFMGALTGPQLELNRWYEIAVSHNRAGEEKLYLDKRLVTATGNIPVFKSEDDVCVGRWLTDHFSDFDLQRVRIFPLLSDEEVKGI